MSKPSLEETVKILKDMKVTIPLPQAAITQKKRNSAIDMAIEALNCSEMPNNSDCISRQAAIDSMCELMRHWFGCDSKDEIREIKRELGKLPSTQPEEIALHESCTDCPLYDKDRHRCPRFNKVIPETLRELQPAQPQYEELTPEEAASEIASGSIMSAWYWLDAMIRLKQMGYAICRKR